VVGVMEVAAARSVELVGPVPKAVSYHGLRVDHDEGGWRCRAIVDV